MTRVPEPELMDNADQAEAYAAADLSEIQQAMVAYFEARCGALGNGRLLDLGCGSGDMAIRFAFAYPGITVLGVDGSAALLQHARYAIDKARLRDRVQVEQRRLPDRTLEDRSFDAVISNSVLHHLADPGTLWRTVAGAARPGAPVMVMDLKRPADVATAERLVSAHASEARPILQRDFFNSLCAAYRPGEIRAQLDAAGLGAFKVEDVSELHVLAWGLAP